MPDRELPSPEYLRQRLRYEPDTGKLFWREHPDLPQKWNTKWAGKEASSITDTGYGRVAINKRRYKIHRVIWAMIHNEWPSGQIDHIDHNRLNNKIENLRVVSHAGNCQNHSMRPDNTSGVTGVWWDKRRRCWQADIIVNGIKISIGRFGNINEAAIARKAAEIRYGFHANHGTLAQEAA